MQMIVVQIVIRFIRGVALASESNVNLFTSQRPVHIRNNQRTADKSICTKAPSIHIDLIELDLPHTLPNKDPMAHRAISLDPHVFSIRDLKEQGSRRLPPEYRG